MSSVITLKSLKLLYGRIRSCIIMSGRKKSTDKEELKGVERILALSDADFEKWVDRVLRAGLRIKR